MSCFAYAKRSLTLRKGWARNNSDRRLTADRLLQGDCATERIHASGCKTITASRILESL
jgi:hypothetical protein